jgi:hypothetical protein
VGSHGHQPCKKNTAGHHKIKGRYLQSYLNEYCYKINRRYFKKHLFDGLTLASLLSTGKLKEIRSINGCKPNEIRILFAGVLEFPAHVSKIINILSV